MIFDGGEDWFAVTPDGRFDGSEGGRRMIGIRVRGGLNVVPVGEGAKEFYRPGLVAAVLSGESPKPPAEEQMMPRRLFALAALLATAFTHPANRKGAGG